MSASSPSSVHIEEGDCVPQPQTYQVTLSYSGEDEAGRFATASRDISPGELVLTALPYVYVFNPSEFTSALYLTASAVHGHAACGATASSAKTSAGLHKSKAKTKASAPAQTDEPESSPHASYTTCATWCSGCLSPIAPGARLVNALALGDVALGVSVEQDAVEETLTAAAQLAAASHTTAAAAASAAASAAATGIEGDGSPDAPTESGEEKRKLLKKPTKSAKMRKDTAVELRERLHESALLQREIALQTHRQRAREPDFLASLNDYSGWWADAESAAETATTATPTSTLATSVETAASGDAGRVQQPHVVVGCTGCGVMVYCSRACWQSTHKVQHVDSGECAVLRRVYPRIMKEYFAMRGGTNNSGGSAKSRKAGPAASSVVMPGLPEVLQWARATSEEKSLEAQSMLMAAVVMYRAMHEGHGARWWAARAAPTTDADAPITTQPSQSTQPTEAAPLASAVPTPSRNPGAAAGAKGLSAPTEPHTESTVVPREVAALQEARQRLGLTGKVELMDDAAAATLLGRPCRDAEHAPEPVSRVDDVTTLAGPFYGSMPLRWPHATSPASTSVRQALSTPAYADMASMITNLSVLSKDRRAVFATYYRRFVKLFLSWLPIFDVTAGIGSPASGARVSAESLVPLDLAQHMLPEETFLRLCAAAQCNSFGVYSADDRCVGFAVYPDASYFNHSCYPNLCRVMRNGARSASFYALRPVQRGEPLTICYTDVQEQNTAERRRNLLHTYRFFCQCERCAGGVGASMRSDQGETMGAIGLCTACPVRGYLRPIPPAEHYPNPALAMQQALRAEGHRDDAGDKTAFPPHWEMSSVLAKQCTVCERVYTTV